MNEDYTKVITALMTMTNVYKETNAILANDLGKVQVQLLEAHEQIVSLRKQLAQYVEREKTMGWNQV
jgi:hypothetical protein